ncbi:MAG: acyl-CoA dehydrogenase family protein [Polyangiaceae bacterium]|nr:acyl-CoA dehydrogenase family protein [Polyangiaceae bacterium]
MADESFIKGLFGGIITESLVFPFPEPSRADGDEVHAIVDALRKFSAKHVDSAKIDRDEEISNETLAALKAIGAFGWLVPKKYGGTGLNPTTHARVMQELAGIDASLALTVSAHQSLGVAAIVHFANPELKARWLPQLATGAMTAAFALTETGAGSDAAAIRTRADLDGDHYVITGDKAWVTNGGFSDLFVVVARTSAADEGTTPSLTAFVVPRSQGVCAQRREPTLGVRGAHISHVTFDHVRVPMDHVLGEVDHGLKVAMEVLTQARLSLASACVGASKRMLKLAVDRVIERKAFGRRISEYGLMRDKIARMTASIFALESMTYLTTGIASAGFHDYATESAICKVVGSETLWHIANDTQQIAAALGYTRTEPYERLLRDARAPMVLEGTNEVLRSFVALSGLQGRSHELEDLAKAIREPIKGFGLLSDFAVRKARSALGRARLSKAHPMLARETDVFEQYSGYFAKSVSNSLRRHGTNITEMQYTQRRLANVAIDLYAIVAIVARTTRAIEQRGEEGARREIDLGRIFVSSAKKRLAAAIGAFDENDDELRKAMAQKTCADGGYPLDIL